MTDGGEALRALRDDNDERLAANPNVAAGLEVIVRTDGSRPSFMIRDGDIDRSTSPVAGWSDTLDTSRVALMRAIACVGRIDTPCQVQPFVGTGFLVHENLIVTNRHVLQMIGKRRAGGWHLEPGTTIDFGHEHHARASVTPRRFSRVVFCGSRWIYFRRPLDHTRLDLALIELEPAAPSARTPSVLALDLAPDWARPGKTIFTIGYPGDPGPAETATLLETLFQSTFGCKRIAPGRILQSDRAVHSWTFAHDATTLGGNSGSVVLVTDREQLAAGLHYGGLRNPAPRENFGHVLGHVLDETDGQSQTTLREHLHQYGVTLVDSRL